MKRTDHARPWRLLSLLLVVFMLASAFPMAAFAEGEVTGADAGTTEAKRPEELLLKLDALDKDSATYNPQNLTLVNSEPQGFIAILKINANNKKRDQAPQYHLDSIIHSSSGFALFLSIAIMQTPLFAETRQNRILYRT